MMTEASIPKYSMLIEWSPDDDAYLVTIPELPGCKTHGDSYEDAAKNGREVIELVVAGLHEDGVEVPAPRWHRHEEPIVIQTSRERNAVRRAS